MIGNKKDLEHEIMKNIPFWNLLNKINKIKFFDSPKPSQDKKS